VVVAGRAFGVKNTLGYMAGLILTIVSLASGHAVRGVSERGPAINQGPHQIQN